MESEEGGGRGEAWGMMGEVGTEGDHRPAEVQSSLGSSHNGCGKYIHCMYQYYTVLCVCCNLP